MILIFMAAGVFVGTVGRDSAESVAYLLLAIFPTEFAVVVLFRQLLRVHLDGHLGWDDHADHADRRRGFGRPPASIFRCAW